MPVIHELSLINRQIASDSKIQGRDSEKISFSGPDRSELLIPDYVCPRSLRVFVDTNRKFSLDSQ